MHPTFYVSLKACNIQTPEPSCQPACWFSSLHSSAYSTELGVTIHCLWLLFQSMLFFPTVSFFEHWCVAGGHGLLEGWFICITAACNQFITLRIRGLSIFQYFRLDPCCKIFLMTHWTLICVQWVTCVSAYCVLQLKPNTQSVDNTYWSILCGTLPVDYIVPSEAPFHWPTANSYHHSYCGTTTLCPVTLILTWCNS